MSSDSPYQTRDVQHFESWSRHYEQSWMQRRLFGPVHAATLDLAASLPAPATILDIGCGTGRLLREAARRWPNAALIGVDPAEGMVEVARNLTPGVTIYRALAESLPLPDASVDLALSTVSFHHWGDQAAAFREIARILRPGGYFILSDFAPPSILAQLHLTGRAQPAAARVRLLANAGFSVVRRQNMAYPMILATVATLKAP